MSSDKPENEIDIMEAQAAIKYAPYHLKAVSAKDEGHPQNGGKCRNPSDHDEGTAAKIPRTSQVPHAVEPVHFSSVHNPKNLIDCLLQIDNKELAGSLSSRNGGYAVCLYLDAARSGSPNIGLSFRHPGSAGATLARVNWHIDSKISGRWNIQKFKYQFVARAPNDKAINHETATSQCEMDCFDRLVCLTLRLTSDSPGCHRKVARHAPQTIRDCIGTIFSGNKDYTLRIWFVVPWTDRDLEQNCLSIMQRFFDARQEPLCRYQDDNGIYYLDSIRKSRMNPDKSKPKSGGTKHRSGTGDVSERAGLSTIPNASTREDISASKHTHAAKPNFMPIQRQIISYGDLDANVAVPSFDFNAPGAFVKPET